MSKYHKHCCSSSTPAKKPVRNKKPRMLPKVTAPLVIEPENKAINTVGLLTTKPFCDCTHCACRDCPDILKMLSITVSDTTCHFGSKVSPKDEVAEASKPATLKLIDLVNHDRDCNCGVVARGIRDHIHMNIGMTKRRDKIKEQIENCDTHCSKLLEAGKSTATKEQKTVVIKDNPAENKPAENICPLCESLSHDSSNPDKPVHIE